MRDTLTVAKFTASDMIKRKSFIISTIIILAMIVVGFNIPTIIKKIKKDDDKIIIIDKNNIFEDKINLLETNKKIQIENIEIDEIKNQIEDGKIEYGIVIEKENNNIIFTYILENKMSSGPSEEFI